MKTLVKNGQAVLDNDPDTMGWGTSRAQRVMLRVYYVSQADDLVFVDIGPMTQAQADEHQAQLNPKLSLCKRVERYARHTPRTAWQGARAVAMPITSVTA